MRLRILLILKSFVESLAKNTSRNEKLHCLISKFIQFNYNTKEKRIVKIRLRIYGSTFIV